MFSSPVLGPPIMVMSHEAKVNDQSKFCADIDGANSGELVIIPPPFWD